MYPYLCPVPVPYQNLKEEIWDKQPYVVTTHANIYRCHLRTSGVRDLLDKKGSEDIWAWVSGIDEC